jgi:hypothetical protein
LLVSFGPASASFAALFHHRVGGLGRHVGGLVIMRHRQVVTAGIKPGAFRQWDDPEVLAALLGIFILLMSVHR